jgi:hypothetical protein
MSTSPLRIASIVVLFVMVFIFGFWLSRAGKPYPAAAFTIHKLAGVGAAVLLGITFYKAYQMLALGPLQTAALLAAALLFLVTIITGGLVSVNTSIPPFVSRLHQVTPYLTLLSSAGALYLVLG